MIYAVDIDGTLTLDGGDDWAHQAIDFLKSEPDKEAIEKINTLYDAGHRIVIYTARPYAMEVITQILLEHLGVKHHELICGKFKADCYVDSRAKRPSEL